MKEYSAKYAHHFRWTLSNLFLINPALKRIVPKSNVQGKLLDVGCGHGDHYKFAQSKGYLYLGLDNSKAMLEVARRKYPTAEFIHVNATAINVLSIKHKYDVVLCNMLFTSFKKLSDITKCLSQLKRVLNKSGKIVVTVSHPCFDPYVQTGLLNRKDVITKFTGYNAAGTLYKITPPDSHVPFHDFHRTLTEYFTAAMKAGLYIETIDECPVDKKIKQKEPEFYKRKSTFPSYLALVFKQLKK